MVGSATLTIEFSSELIANRDADRKDRPSPLFPGQPVHLGRRLFRALPARLLF